GLQGQGQAQLGLQGQGQGQGQAQGQSEAQTAAQAVAQYASDANANGNLNGNGNGNGNLNLNGNGNGNENVNANCDTNSLSNHLDNAVSNTDLNNVANHVDNCVTTAVNVDVSIDLSGLDLKPQIDNSVSGDFNHGIQFSMPDWVNQAQNGCGGNAMFNLDQVNNLVANNGLESASVNFGGGQLGDGSVFSQIATAEGGCAATIGAAVAHDSSPGTVSASADAPITQDAFTQSIVMGANIQFNSANFNVVGHDSVTTDLSGVGGHHGPV
ncbi:MAG: hypothetical protein JSS04_12420, partial [Proteobacteria bacterium]|nr:hypothetical protein [Pseudomonadota bacterium]